MCRPTHNAWYTYSISIVKVQPSEPMSVGFAYYRDAAHLCTILVEYMTVINVYIWIFYISDMYLTVGSTTAPTSRTVVSLLIIMGYNNSRVWDGQFRKITPRAWTDEIVTVPAVKVVRSGYLLYIVVVFISVINQWINSWPLIYIFVPHSKCSQCMYSYRHQLRLISAEFLASDAYPAAEAFAVSRRKFFEHFQKSSPPFSYKSFIYSCGQIIFCCVLLITCL